MRQRYKYTFFMKEYYYVCSCNKAAVIKDGFGSSLPRTWVYHTTFEKLVLSILQRWFKDKDWDLQYNQYVSSVDVHTGNISNKKSSRRNVQSTSVSIQSHTKRDDEAAHSFIYLVFHLARHQHFRYCYSTMQNCKM